MWMSLCVCDSEKMSEPRTLSSASLRQIVQEVSLSRLRVGWSWRDYNQRAVPAWTCMKSQDRKCGGKRTVRVSQSELRRWQRRVTASKSSQLGKLLSQRWGSEQWRRWAVRAGTLAREVSQRGSTGSVKTMTSDESAFLIAFRIFGLGILSLLFQICCFVFSSFPPTVCFFIVLFFCCPTCECSLARV